MEYDLVVAGGSFAGLVLATRVRGKVALIEKGEIGSGQTSACATTMDLVRKLRLEESVEEVHREAVIHTRRGTHRFRLPYQFCSFDYRTFCRLLMARFDGELIKSAATRVEGGEVVTSDGRHLRGRALVDATGWRATLARSVDPTFPAAERRSYGLEKPASGFEQDGLHFYFDPGVRGDGYGWAFPAGEHTRAGVLSYIAADGVRESTEAFLEAEGMRGEHYHGGWLSAGLRPAIAGDVFCVGDSAGHCLPLTGEGIRPAVFFAQRLAALLESERRGETSRRATQSAYRELQASHARRYGWLRAAQRALRDWPDPPVGWFFRVFGSEGSVYRQVSRVYWDVAAPLEAAA